MAGNISNTYENRMLDWSLNVGTPTRASATAIALVTSASSDSALGTEVANSNAYARTTATFAAASAGATSNNADITFPTASGGAWGLVVGGAVMDSATYAGGNMIWYGPLTTNKQIDDGDTFKILNGDLDITLD